jgi:GT2 family glycosyltransferase
VYNRWIARGGNIGNLVDASHLPETQEVERKMAYVVGASMLVRQSFVQQVGFMDEQYFLSFEEIDWVTSANGLFELAYSPRSIVYHKEGASTGSHRLRSHRSPLIEFYVIRNRLLFTRRHHPFALPSVLCVIIMSALYRLMKRRWKSLGALIRGVFRGLAVTDAIRKQQ